MTRSKPEATGTAADHETTASLARYVEVISQLRDELQTLSPQAAYLLDMTAKTLWEEETERDIAYIDIHVL